MENLWDHGTKEATQLKATRKLRETGEGEESGTAASDFFRPHQCPMTYFPPFPSSILSVDVFMDKVRTLEIHSNP